MRITPLEPSLYLLGIWVEQELVVVKPHSGPRVVRSSHPITVQEPGTCLRKIAMPDLVRVFVQLYAMKFPPARRIEQAKLHSFGMLGEKSEIYTLAIPCCAKRIGFTRPDDRFRLTYQRDLATTLKKRIRSGTETPSEP